MPKPRTWVHNLLVELTGYEDRVYFNPPETVKMKYPCIVYDVADLGSRHADNIPYYRYDTYTVTHIYPSEKDRDISLKIAETPHFAFDRRFHSDNLHHDVFTLKVY